MHADAFPPPLGERRHLLVALQDGVQQRAAEQRQHRQIGLPVPAVRGRVDHMDPAVRAPQHVAAPQVAVQPRGRLGGPRQLRQPRADLLDHRRLAGCPSRPRRPPGADTATHGAPRTRPTSRRRDVAHRGEPDERLHRTARRRRPERGRAGMARRPPVRARTAAPHPGPGAPPSPGRGPATPSRPCTRGTGGVPASASQRSPAASARAASASSARFTTTVRPSSRAASASEPDSGRTPVTARPVSRAATAAGVSSPDAGNDRGICGLLGWGRRSAARPAYEPGVGVADAHAGR